MLRLIPQLTRGCRVQYMTGFLQCSGIYSHIRQSSSQTTIPHSMANKLNQLLSQTNSDVGKYIKDNFDTPDKRETQIKQYIHTRNYVKLEKFYFWCTKLGLTLSSHTYTLLIQGEASKALNPSLDMVLAYFHCLLENYKNEVNLVQPLLPSELAQIARVIFGMLQRSNHFIDLMTLNMVWQHHFSSLEDVELEMEFHSTYFQILLNTDQLIEAGEYLQYMVELFRDNPSQYRYILKKVPIIAFCDKLAETNDCDKLSKWLMEIVEFKARINTDSIISQENWLRYLHTGLLANNYQLVKTVYDHYIMKGFKNSSISTEEAILQDINSKNSIFNTITDDTIFHILHTLSTNGDVNLTLSLIESHFLHKSLKGEKALTKELCIKIIESYCYHGNLQEDWDDTEFLKSEKDQSIVRVLDVLNGFVSKALSDNAKVLSYKDITSSMSVKLFNYRAYDLNIEKSDQRKANIAELIISAPENQFEANILPRKLSNANIQSSKYGNILANLEVLHDCVVDIISYSTEKEHHPQTITLFVNCLLNHLNIHQNFSGIVSTMLTLHQINSNFMNDWFNQELYDILVNSIANSSSAKKSSVLVYSYMKENGFSITTKHYSWFISSQLRGYIHDGLQFFIYQNLKDFKYVDPSVIELLDQIPKKEIGLNPGTESLLKMLHKLGDGIIEPNDVDEFWLKNQLNKLADTILVEKPNTFNRIYYEKYDIRDMGYLEFIFRK